MKRQLAGLLHRIAPRTIDGLRDISVTRERFGSIESAIAKADIEYAQRMRDQLADEIAELRVELDELRRDSRRVAELYDLVFEQVRASASHAPRDQLR
jgi:hypothetical protein